MHKIDVKVCGLAGTGLTTVSILIADALKAAGFQVDITDDDIIPGTVDHLKNQSRRVDAVKLKTEISVMSVRYNHDGILNGAGVMSNKEVIATLRQQCAGDK